MPIKGRANARQSDETGEEARGEGGERERVERSRMQAGGIKSGGERGNSSASNFTKQCSYVCTQAPACATQQ